MTLLEITAPLAFFLTMVFGFIAFAAICSSLHGRRKIFFFFMILAIICVFYGHFINIKYAEKLKQEIQSTQTIDANVP